jgi:hypothetical protein
MLLARDLLRLDVTTISTIFAITTALLAIFSPSP